MLGEKEQIQEEQYSYPYHYIPSSIQGFKQFQYWGTGFRYLGTMELVFNELSKIEYSSLIDIGCGDGRFIRELLLRFPDKDVKGIDYSNKAISLAKAMNPDIGNVFLANNILDTDLNFKADIITLIEVLEHIEPTKINDFVKSMVNLLDEKGMMILTVPHINKPVIEKHYQHFNSDLLKIILSDFFEELTFIPFDNIKSKKLKYFHKIIGGYGKCFILTNDIINETFYKMYLSNYLYTQDETTCGRIAVICKRPIK